MKILRVIASMKPSTGGPCQGIRYSIREMAKQGIVNEVVCLDDPMTAMMQQDEFVIHNLGPAVSQWQYSKKLVSWLFNNFERFDIVIVHGCWLYHGFAVLTTLRKYLKMRNRTAVPLVYIMPHGMLDPYFQKAKERKFKALRNLIYWLVIEKHIVNEANGLLFTCETELISAQRTFPMYKPKSTLNVGYGVPSPPEFQPKMRDAFHSLCPNLANRAFILFLGRVHEKKGIDLLLKAYEQVYTSTTNGVNNKVPKLEAEQNRKIPALVIAGPGLDSEYGQTINQLANELGLQNTHVFFTGMLTGLAKWGAMHIAEAFILPSHHENFGIAVVEALACGTPVLISNKVNIWTEINNCSAGITKDDNFPGVCELLRNWKEMGVDKRQIVSSNAKKCYSNYFSIEQATTQLANKIRSPVPEN